MEKFTKGRHYPVQYGGFFTMQPEPYYECDIDLLDLEDCPEAEANSKLYSYASEMYDLLKRAQEFFAGYDSPLEREIKELLNKINS